MIDVSKLKKGDIIWNARESGVAAWGVKGLCNETVIIETGPIEYSQLPEFYHSKAEALRAHSTILQGKAEAATDAYNDSLKELGQAEKGLTSEASYAYYGRFVRED